MGKIQWDRQEDRHFEYGVDHGVLYTEYAKGDPSQQDISNLLQPPGVRGLEFYYPAHTEYSDYGPDQHSQILNDQNKYPEDFFYNHLNWQTYKRYHNGWTDNKTVSNGNVVDGVGKAVSDLFEISNSYAFWFWCATKECFPMIAHFYKARGYSGSDPVYTYLGSGTVNDAGGFVVTPGRSLNDGPDYMRLEMPVHDYTIDSLYIVPEAVQGDNETQGIPSNWINLWKEACAFEYGEEPLVIDGSDPDIPYSYYKYNGKIYSGVAWNGLTGVTESPDGAEPTDLWADNIKYATMRSAETFGATIEAYSYPEEFFQCDGIESPISGVLLGQQKRKPFGFAYRTKTEKEDGYKIHIIYNATASPSEKSYESINDSPDAITFSWEISTTPLSTKGYKPVSTVVIDPERYLGKPVSALPSEDGYDIVEPIHVLEAILFGTEYSNPFLPSPNFINRLLNGDRPIGIRGVYINIAALLNIIPYAGSVSPGNFTQLDLCEISPNFKPMQKEYAIFYDSSEAYAMINIDMVKYDSNTTIGAHSTQYSINGYNISTGSDERNLNSLETFKHFMVSNDEIERWEIPTVNGNYSMMYLLYLIPDYKKDYLLDEIKFTNIPFQLDPLRMSKYVPPGSYSIRNFPTTVYYDSESVSSSGVISFVRRMKNVPISASFSDLDDSNNSFDVPATTGDMPAFNLSGHRWNIRFNVFASGNSNADFTYVIELRISEPQQTPIEVDIPDDP